MTHRLLPAQRNVRDRVVTPQSETISELLAENMELREQIANIILQTASLREMLENQRTRH
jgi:hypothetical protein